MMTIVNRDSFLNKVAERLGRPRKNRLKKPIWNHNPQEKVGENLRKTGLVQSLKDQCKTIHTDFYETNKEELPRLLAQIIEEFQGERLIISDDDRNNQYHLNNLYQALEKEGKDLHFWNKENEAENHKKSERADIGITFSDITLAESATLVLMNNASNGRSVSLLPEIHISLIEESTLVPRLTNATKKISQQIELGESVSSCVSFITGPSNSADIEMKLIVGVHGPVHVIYVFIHGV